MSKTINKSQRIQGQIAAIEAYFDRSPSPEEVASLYAGIFSSVGSERVKKLRVLSRLLQQPLENSPELQETWYDEKVMRVFVGLASPYLTKAESLLDDMQEMLIGAREIADKYANNLEDA